MEILFEVLEETVIMLPMLFIMYLILEYSEMHNNTIFDKLKNHGPLYGALLGVIPQCGISVIASILFLERKITIGTLISIYIATSDEAIPLLLSDPSLAKVTFNVLVVKLITGIIFGYVIDYFVKIDFDKKEIKQGKNMLTSAALTYVASVATTLLEILRLILMFTGRNND